jgi:Tol biopolymer transport system component
VLAEGIDNNPSAGYAPIATAAAGVIAYRGSARSEHTELTFFDREGNPLPPALPAGIDHEARLSPDASRVAVERFDMKSQVRDVWVIEVARGVASRLTFGPSLQICPVWSPDGQRIAYASSRLGRFGLYERPANGAGEEKLLLEPGPARCPTDWSRDGRFLAYEERSDEEPDLFALPLVGERKPLPLAATRFYESQAAFSPDGRFVALTSRESGAREVYVQSFPDGRSRWRVSPSGGIEPRWRSDGRELFYLGPDDRVMAVQVSGSRQPDFSLPAALGARARRLTDNRNHYDVSGDGKRFLLNRLADERHPSFVSVIVDWGSQPPPKQRRAP